MHADVRSIDALREWHAVLTAHGETLAEALAGVELELRRSFDWLAEQLSLWQRAARECYDDVVQAKAELATRKFPDWTGREPDTTTQEKNLRRAQARLEHAENQVVVIRGWVGRLPKLIEEAYRGAATRLTHQLEGDLPRGLAQLARQAEALEKYAGLRSDYAAAPAVASPPGANAPGSPAAPGAPRTPAEGTA